MTPALDDPATRHALRRYRLRSLLALGVGLAVWAGVAVALDTRGARASGSAWLVAVGLVPGLLGALPLLHSVRMEQALRRHPWVEWQLVYRDVALGTPLSGPTLFLGPNGEHVLSLVAFSWRWDLVSHEKTVWLAGSPEHGGVVAPSGRRDLLWCRRPVLRLSRRLLARRLNAAAPARQLPPSAARETLETRPRA